MTVSTFTAKDVMTLRQKTGLGMLECKKALTETNGDIEAAEQFMREKLKGKMDTRTERATGEGRVGIVINGDHAAIVEVRTESDFTAKNDNFVEMVEKVAGIAVGLAAGDIEPNDEMTKAIDDLRISTGENVNFARGEKLEGGAFGMYLHHDGKRAAIVQIEGDADEDTLKGVCQHIVFHDPAGVDEDDVDASKVEQIRADAIEEAKASGKNDEIAGKIADGKVRKYFEENTLVNQKYVLDETRTVKDALGDAKVVKFVRYTLGA